MNLTIFQGQASLHVEPAYDADDGYPRYTYGFHRLAEAMQREVSRCPCTGCFNAKRCGQQALACHRYGDYVVGNANEVRRRIRARKKTKIPDHIPSNAIYLEIFKHERDD